MERMISGVKPSGSSITLGNYLGAIKEFVKYQYNYELFVFVADLHTLTTNVVDAKPSENVKNLVSMYIAAGLNPNITTIFKQSDVPAHNQLEWLLTCNTNVAELTKMPQYKNYIDKFGSSAIPCGMLMYPSLMSADILLYDAKFVPVGEDQRSHVDLTRDVAEKFNRLYGPTFIIPKAVVPKCGAKIMSLSDPTKKMSKSESDAGTVYMLDDENTIRKKIKRAVTDSEYKIYYDVKNKPGISNLLTILSCVSGSSITELEKRFANENNYGKFKNIVADCVCEEVLNVQNNMQNVKNIDDILAAGANKANKLANNKIELAYNNIGLR